MPKRNGIISAVLATAVVGVAPGVAEAHHVDASLYSAKCELVSNVPTISATANSSASRWATGTSAACSGLTATPSTVPSRSSRLQTWNGAPRPLPPVAPRPGTSPAPGAPTRDLGQVHRPLKTPAARPTPPTTPTPADAPAPPTTRSSPAPPTSTSTPPQGQGTMAGRTPRPASACPRSSAIPDQITPKGAKHTAAGPSAGRGVVNDRAGGCPPRTACRPAGPRCQAPRRRGRLSRNAIARTSLAPAPATTAISSLGVVHGPVPVPVEQAHHGLHPCRPRQRPALVVGPGVGAQQQAGVGHRDADHAAGGSTRTLSAIRRRAAASGRCSKRCSL